MEKFIIPTTLLFTLSNPEGFTFEEIKEVITKEENKKFLSELKPHLIEVLKEEFPIISMFI